MVQWSASVRDAFMVGMTPAFTALRAPERLAIISERGTRSYRELNAHANQLVRALRARGLKAGDAVALMCSNRPEFVEVYAAVIRAGLRATFLNWHLQADEAAYIVADCQARAFIAEDRAAAAALVAAARLPQNAARIAIGAAIEGFENYAEVLRAERDTDIDDPIQGNVMLYTSGTTGRPKGVRRRSDVPTVSGPVARVPLVGGESTSLCTGPLYHSAPFAYNLVGPVHRGATMVLMDRWEPEQTLRLITEHRVTHTHLVATMFHRLLALAPEVRARYDLSSLRYVLHGAAPTPVHVKRAILEWFGPIVYEYYAGTEGGGCAITPEEWLAKPGSVGKPTAGRTLEILDDANRVLPAGEIGRVFFSVPEAGGFEYFGDPEKTRAAYEGNRFTLGDRGYVDADGYLFLTGRTSEVIIAGGVNIYPAEIDSVLLMHPAVADVAAVGVPNEEFGEEVKAVVMVADGRESSAALEQELIAFCREHLAHFKCPRSVDFVADLPRSDAGKVQRRVVRKGYWDKLGREI